MITKIRSIFAIGLIITCAYSCTREGQTERVFLANELKFNAITNFTKKSNIIDDSLKANGGTIWVVNGNFSYYYTDSTVLKDLNDMDVQRVDITRFLTKEKKEYIILFYFKEDSVRLVWKSVALDMPLRFTIKKQIKNQWFLVDSD